MKTCPRCARKYSDSESFCEVDGTALIAGSATPSASEPQGEGESAEQPIECPVCGGKAQPGEAICNFCGARLLQDSGAAPPAGGAARRSPETFVPSQEKLTATNFTPPPEEPDEEREEGSGRSMASVIGYSVAALVALAAGAWLAVHLSSAPTNNKPKIAVSSPVATPAAPVAMEPTVALARSLRVHTFGASASAPERGDAAARNTFETNKKALLDAYRGVLASDATVDDGMMVRLTIAPSGEVTDAAVRTSTTPNPELDAGVVKSMLGWRFTPFNGESVKADYPIIFARDSAQAAAIDSSLAAKVAALAPGATPEYASAPAVPVATPSPRMEAVAPPSPAPTPAREVSKPRRPPHRRRAAVRPPPRPLLERVESALRSNRKFGRVKVYTNGSVVTLYGKVFNNTDRLLAARTARRVNGVSDVINQIATDQALWAAQQRRIEQSLAANGLTGVTVKVIGKDAYLNGEVKTELDRERAVTIAEGAAPVKVRTNLIRVAPGRVFGF